MPLKRTRLEMRLSFIEMKTEGACFAGLCGGARGAVAAGDKAPDGARCGQCGSRRGSRGRGAVLGAAGTCTGGPTLFWITKKARFSDLQPCFGAGKFDHKGTQHQAPCGRIQSLQVSANPCCFLERRWGRDMAASIRSAAFMVTGASLVMSWSRSARLETLKITLKRGKCAGRCRGCGSCHRRGGNWRLVLATEAALAGAGCLEVLQNEITGILPLHWLKEQGPEAS